MNKALARLRHKTDRELCILAEKQLEQTLTIAQAGQVEDAARSYGVAKRLVAVAALSHSERARVDDLVAQIEVALHPVAAVA